MVERRRMKMGEVLFLVFGTLAVGAMLYWMFKIG
jgi:hypothetical protein